MCDLCRAKTNHCRMRCCYESIHQDVFVSFDSDSNSQKQNGWKKQWRKFAFHKYQRFPLIDSLQFISSNFIDCFFIYFFVLCCFSRLDSPFGFRWPLGLCAPHRSRLIFPFLAPSLFLAPPLSPVPSVSPAPLLSPTPPLSAALLSSLGNCQNESMSLLNQNYYNRYQMLFFYNVRQFIIELIPQYITKKFVVTVRDLYWNRSEFSWPVNFTAIPEAAVPRRGEEREEERKGRSGGGEAERGNRGDGRKKEHGDNNKNERQP